MGEAESVPSAFAQAGEAGTLGARPLIVVSAGELPPMPGLSEATQAEMAETLGQLQSELASLSTNSDHRVIEGAFHYVHRDRPDAVIQAVADVVGAVRTGSLLTSNELSAGDDEALNQR